MVESMSGGDLEAHGLALFNDQMGLEVVRPTTKTVRLLELDPEGPHESGESLELDYLVPRGEVCLIGEITSRSNSTSIKGKFDRFRRQYELVSGKLTSGSRANRRKVLLTLGVPEDKVGSFLEITSCKGFYLQTQNSRSDYEVPQVPGIAAMYSSDWEQLQEYAQAIGEYAQHPFFDRFGLERKEGNRVIRIKPEPHHLHREAGRTIASNVEPADVFTFVANPYDLLHIARVFRRDELAPQSKRDRMYQRALLPEKLRKIRNVLRANPKFMFPNGILLVLESNCEYTRGNLDIADCYGSVIVIDGQHRLFSYADPEIEEISEKKAKIPVTAAVLVQPDLEGSLRCVSE